MNKRSFTLLELLIVIVIIGIIATIAIPHYERLIEKARVTEAKRVLNAFADSLWRYYIETGHWPPTETGGSIPTCLDIRVPESKCFSYLYRISPGNLGSPGNIVSVEARYLLPPTTWKPHYTYKPGMFWLIYNVEYVDSQGFADCQYVYPGPCQFQKMDNDLYKVYFRWDINTGPFCNWND